MEEYGKALYLKEYSRRGSYAGKFPKWFEDHKMKFDKAKNQLIALPEEIGINIRVPRNISPKGVTIRASDGQTVTFESYQTGEKMDTTNPCTKKPLSVKLRFESFYVDWGEGKWHYPEPVLSEGEIMAEEVLASYDLNSCITILKNELASALF